MLDLKNLFEKSLFYGEGPGEDLVLTSLSPRLRKKKEKKKSLF